MTGQSLQVSHVNSVVECFAGKRGMGKSWAAFKRFEQLARTGRYANLVVFDPLVCSWDWDELAAQLHARLLYVEYDFDKNEPRPAIPFGPAAKRDDPDWRNTLYLLDEADLLSSPAKIDPTLRKILHYSRHWASSLLLTFRRFQNVHKDIEGLASAVHVFATSAPRDLNRCDELLEGLESTDGKLYSRERIRALRPFRHERYEL